MLVVKDHNNVLSQQLGALQVHNHKLSDDLQTKIEVCICIAIFLNNYYYFYAN